MTLNLSRREREIIRLASQGHTDKGIAAELGISPTTVVTYWGRIRSKFGQASRSELVADFIRAEAEEAVEQMRELLQAHIRRETELAQREEMLRDFIDQAPEAILRIDVSGKIVDGNKEAAALLECDQSELPGLPVERLIPQQHATHHHEHREQYLRDPHKLEIGHETGIPILTLKGKAFRGIVTLNMVNTCGVDMIVAILRSLDEHQEHGSDVRRVQPA